MIYFADTNPDPATLALITIVGAVITALFKLLSANTNALVDLVKETRKGNNEAKERNGHLGEQSVHLASLVVAQNKDVASIQESTAKTAEILSKSALIAAEDRDLLTASPQVIHEQTVERQVVQEKA